MSDTPNDSTTTLRAEYEGCRTRSDERWASNDIVVKRMEKTFITIDGILRGMNGNPGLCEQIRQSKISFRKIFVLLIINIFLMFFSAIFYGIFK